MLALHRDTRLHMLKNPEVAAYFLKEALASDDDEEFRHALTEVRDAMKNTLTKPKLSAILQRDVPPPVEV